MKEKTIVRENLMTVEFYAPYCGNLLSRNDKNGCDNPRTKFNGKQFICPKCKFTTLFEDDFITRYKLRWSL